MLLFFAPIVFSYDISEISIKDTINSDKSISEIIRVSLVNNSKSSFLFTLPQFASDARLNGKSIDTKNGSILIPLSCKECKFEVSFRVDEIVKRNFNEMVFSRTLNFPKNPSIINYEVLIPPGYVIKENELDPAIVPVSEISSDGKNIIISWHEENPVLPKRYFIRFFEHEHLSLGISEIKSELEEPAVWMIAVIFLIIGVFFGRLLDKKFHSPKISELIPSSLLNPDEKAVIALLSKNNMKLSQKEITRMLNWSKSKVSAIVNNLEYKKIIAREKIGRSYNVKLLKKISD